MNSPFSKQELIDCVEREVRMRERVYRERIAMGKMSQRFAGDEIAKMKAVLEVVREMPGIVPPQADLFGGGS